MNAHWMTALVLGTAMTAACAGSPQKAEDTQVPAAAAGQPVEAAAPQPAALAPAAASPVDTAAPKSTAKPASARPAPRPTAPAAPALSASAAAPDPAPTTPPPAPRVEYRDLKIAAGTALPLELITPISSETAEVETPVRAKLKQTISVDGFALLPAGTEFIGTVTEVERAGRVKGRARMSIAFTEVSLSGTREKVRTNPVTFEAQATKGKDAAKIGVGAGVGAVIGGILGGGSGAAKGAAIGGGAGTGVVLATKGEDVTVDAGADVNATLAAPYEARVRLQ
ncbi:MAG TPA: hypothetical protein VFV95_12675 [Vicinamibacterales bacterium]|nr:hypothetical protein [Vicinamibacterales bacterium]